MAAAQAAPDGAADRNAIEARLAQLTELVRGLMAALAYWFAGFWLK